MNSVFRCPAGERAVMDAYRHLLDGWPVPMEERRIPTREGDTFVVVCGKPGHPR